MVSGEDSTLLILYLLPGIANMVHIGFVGSTSIMLPLAFWSLSSHLQTRVVLFVWRP